MIEHLIAEPMFAERPFAVKHFEDIRHFENIRHFAEIRSVRIVERPGRTRFVRVAMLPEGPPVAPAPTIASIWRRPLALGRRRRSGRDCHTPAAV